MCLHFHNCFLIPFFIPRYLQEIVIQTRKCSTFLTLHCSAATFASTREAGSMTSPSVWSCWAAARSRPSDTSSTTSSSVLAAVQIDLSWFSSGRKWKKIYCHVEHLSYIYKPSEAIFSVVTSLFTFSLFFFLFFLPASNCVWLVHCCM